VSFLEIGDKATCFSKNTKDEISGVHLLFCRVDEESYIIDI
jgi:hypothetical protein